MSSEAARGVVHFRVLAAAVPFRHDLAANGMVECFVERFICLEPGWERRGVRRELLTSLFAESYPSYSLLSRVVGM